MAPKQRITAQTSTPSIPAKPSTSKSGGSANAQDIVSGIWNKYLEKTPQRVKLLDSFMAFLAVVGALQFLYVIIVGNFVRLPFYPFQMSFNSPLYPKEDREYIWVE